MESAGGNKNKEGRMSLRKNKDKRIELKEGREE